ncbi:SRPBCC domain-containing protein [Citricoccus parietis]|uniref:SRPBCC domain-containing protein n=1 Tax=Citricoccus parietis TaxID=592307 RepID=A0ABV6F2X8_9MICC
MSETQGLPEASGEPTARIEREGQGCLAIVEVTVPGPAEEVWESVASGPGYRRWFVEAELEPRVGGALVTHHGDFGDSEGTITAWDPPHRYAYVEPDWMGEGTPVPDWATEITLEPVPDDGPPATLVRLTSGVATEADTWGEDIEGTLPGWRSALRLLAEFHAHVAGRETAQALVMREVPAGHRLTVLLGLDGAVVGQQATARAEADGRHLAVTGTVIEASSGPAGEGPTQQDSVVLRVTDGSGGITAGVYEFGTLQYGETRMSVVRGYLHVPAGADPGAAAAAWAVERDWSAVLDALLA